MRIPASLELVLSFKPKVIYVEREKDYLAKFLIFLDFLVKKSKVERIYLRLTDSFWCVVVAPYYPVKHEKYEDCFNFWDRKVSELNKILTEFKEKCDVDPEFDWLIHFDPICECERKKRYPDKKIVKIGDINGIGVYFKVV